MPLLTCTVWRVIAYAPALTDQTGHTPSRHRAAVDKKAKARFCKLHSPQGHTNVNTHQGRGVKSKEREGQSRRRAEDRGGEESSRGGAGVKEEACSSRRQWVGGGREGEDMDECRDREQGGEEDGENKWGFPATWLDNMPLHMWELPACAGCGANIGDSSSFMVYPCKHTVRVLSLQQSCFPCF